MKYDVTTLGKRIKNLRESRKWSQKVLGEKMQVPVTGKQISLYENDQVIPPLDKLLNLCDLFGCELGYLLGEDDYEKGTKLATKIYETTGLTPKSIERLEYITSSKSRFHFGLESDAYKKMLNAFICADNFIPLMEAFHAIYQCGHEVELLNSKLSARYDDSTLEKAYNIISESDDYEHDKALPLPSQNVIDAVKDIEFAINKQAEVNERPAKIARYEANEAFGSLVKEIFDDYSNLVVK